MLPITSFPFLTSEISRISFFNCSVKSKILPAASVKRSPALISLPAAAALQLARSFRQAIIYSVIFGEISVITGLIAAYYLNLASGGTIVLVAVLLLAVIILYKKLDGLKKFKRGEAV